MDDVEAFMDSTIFIDHRILYLSGTQVGFLTHTPKRLRGPCPWFILQAAFVVSRAIKGTRIGGEVTEALVGYGLPVLETRITQRVSYPGTAAVGSTVMDSEPDSDAAAEVHALANEIKKKLIWEIEVMKKWVKQ